MCEDIAVNLLRALMTDPCRANECYSYSSGLLPMVMATGRLSPTGIVFVNKGRFDKRKRAQKKYTLQRSLMFMVSLYYEIYC